MTTASAATAVAERLTRAVADNDVDALTALYAPGSVVWHSTDQVELKFEEVQHLVRAIEKRVHDLSDQIAGSAPTHTEEVVQL